MINAGDGAYEHPTQALLDALTIRRNKGRIEGLTVAICGDILHSRVARSNIILLNALGAQVRVVAPSTLLPSGVERMGVIVHRNMAEGLKDADVVMMLRLQRERMEGAFVPSVREYFRYYGLDAEKRVLRLGGRLVPLTATEFRLVEALVGRDGRPVSRAEIAGLIDADGRAPDPDRLVDQHVSRLRIKLEPEPGAPRHLQTVRGVGYRFAW